jgi:hypothetical protein
MYVNKHCVFRCIKSKTIHGSMPNTTRYDTGRLDKETTLTEVNDN